ncbi:helix-turn-helix domain-containing protein [Phaeobacter sp. B1627]|uniref:helix-turn-helix domain-containing protein n=1 Tax=Phaeobacter sp. B1627 TaxID=2583809 RepID=UPI00111BB0FC|nr:helix-turn-helix domain-containing protein [Phaeobacter sp. B1627]TNJ38635.1 DNA-binding protein [Phaeobacter sp. B1627]
MVYTLGEAAKATGKSKATISKAIKSGRISASKDDTGAFRIDPSELHRVYPPTPMGEHKETPKETPVNTAETGDFKALQARLEAAQERLADKEAVIADLREDRDKWRQQATALLEDKRPKGFFEKLFRR